MAVIPKVWAEMYKSATYEDALGVFENALVEESNRLNAQIKKPVIFQKDIRRLLALEQNTYEHFSRDSRHNVVLGFKDFLPKTTTEVRRLRQHDETISMMPEDVKDYELIEKLKKLEKGTQEPTTKISTFISALKSYCNSLRV